MDILNGKKTYLAAGAYIITAVARAIGYDIPEGLPEALAGVALIFLRQAVNKGA